MKLMGYSVNESRFSYAAYLESVSLGSLNGLLAVKMTVMSLFLVLFYKF